MSQYIQDYLRKIQNSLLSGQATEHSYRPELRDLFVVISKLNVINEPKGSEHGKPDFIFVKGEGKEALPIAYGEAKDMHIALEKIEKSEQLARYFGYAKLVLTNGVEFRFYKNGIRYGEPVSLGTKKGNEITIHEEKFGIFEDRFVDFLASPTDTIRRAGHLAEIMGGKARRIRDNLREMMQHTEKYVEIWKLYNTFKTEILHDLTLHDFADLYAQTLVYGLFVARYHDKTQENFSRAEARDLVPKSNPLLRRFFDHIAGEGYEKRLEYIVDELCEVFSHADVHALMHGMYQKETHDPVIHFYEDFLGEYDSELRMQRGVFYTPAPVVKFIVRAIDDVLKTHFGLPKGLADSSKIPFKKLVKQDKKGKDVYENTEVHKVQVLDPATGTGTFLNEIVHHIFESMKGQEGMWANYVNKDLLPRLHGFELMMASYTIAHLKLGLTLAETGVENVEKRLQIYLTNSLEEARTDRETQMNIFGLGEAITLEGAYADEVKRDKPVMIVVGNPPYSVSSSNKSPWIEGLMKDYKKDLNERNIQPLSDDYIKFIRFGEHLIEKNGDGVLAYISNNSFIDGAIHRQMRKHLKETFDSIYILNLHGDSRKQEKTPEGGKDENVFDIMQGVSISIFIKSKNPIKKGLFHYDLYGKREEKYDFLENNSLENIQWNDLIKENHGFFTLKNQAGLEKYNNGFSMSDCFINLNSGISTAKDEIVYQYTLEQIEKIENDFKNLSEEMIKNIYEIDKEGEDWRVLNAQKDIKNNSPNKSIILYRPFDFRFTLYSGKSKGFMGRPRGNIMTHINNKKNYGLVISKTHRQKSLGYSFITNTLVDLHILDTAGDSTYFFPLYLYSEAENLDGQTRTPNLDATIWGKVNEVVGETTPEQILDYIYAVLHSPTYRETYKEFLKIDFPRVPYPKDKENFLELVKLGTELRELHLLESPKVQNFITTYPVVGTNEVVKISFTPPQSPSNEGEANPREQGELGNVYINDTQYFGNVPEVAWEFYIGGYQPAQKWLKDRKGRTLTWEDIEHYQQMIVALSETSKIMDEIDKIFKG